MSRNDTVILLTIENMIAFQISENAAKITQCDKPTIAHGEVLITAKYSSLNYKDALGITGKGKIYKGFPKIGGIDVSGIVAESKSDKFCIGDNVLITGCGLGEVFDGGYAEYVKFDAQYVIPLPNGLDLKEAMIYGTAGFTASLCLQRMLQNNQRPEQGPIVVTGASGGVGIFALNFFSRAGFKTIAVSGKKEKYKFLQDQGAHAVLSLSQLGLGTRPLETVRFGGAVDNLGGNTLSALTRHIELWGNIACVGLAESHELHASVMPLILRGVSLLGISSNNCPLELRKQLWKRLATDLKPKNLNSLVSQTGKLSDLPRLAQDMIERKTFGRILIQCEA